MQSDSQNFSYLIVQGAAHGEYVHLDDGTTALNVREISHINVLLPMKVQ